MTTTHERYRPFILLLLLICSQAVLADDPPTASGIQSIRTLRPGTEDGPSSSTHGPIIYDPNGNIVAIGASYYVYDSMSRIKTASVERGGYIHEQTYTYDVYGNRTAVDLVSHSTDPGTNRLTAFGAAYDDAGNLTSWQPAGSAVARHYDYDALNTLIYEEIDPVTSRHHVYTADGERFWTLTGSYGSSCPNGICSRSQISLRDLSGRVLREFTDDGQSGTWVHRDYIYRDAEILASITPTGTHHYSLDHLGTPRVVTGQDGYMLAEHTYFPFGAEITDGAPTDGRLRFTGHEQRDTDVGGATFAELDYMHARYYSNRTGRFLSVDPMLDEEAALYSPQRWNRYSYVAGNPLRYVDPNGELVIAAAPALGVGVLVGTAAVVWHTYQMQTNPQYRAAAYKVTADLLNTLNERSDEFAHRTTEWLKDAYRRASGEARRKLEKELKARRERNKGKARGGKREPKKPKSGNDDPAKSTFNIGEHALDLWTLEGPEGTFIGSGFQFEHNLNLDWERSIACPSGVGGCPF